MTRPGPAHAAPLLPPPPEHIPDASPGTGRWRLFAIGAATGVGSALAGVYVGRVLAREWIGAVLAPLPPGMAWRWGIALTAIFTAILAHELGHVLGGLSQRFRLMLLVVGPLKLSRRELTAPLRLGVNSSLELAGGVAASLPPDDRDLVRRTRWMVAAGPLASIVVTVTSALLLLKTEPAPWSAFVFITGAVSAAITLTAVIPMRNGTFVTDGKRFLELGRQGPEAQRDAIYLLLTVRTQAGARIESFSREHMATLVAPEDGSIMEAMARASVYTWLLAHGRVAEARAHLERAVTLSSSLPHYVKALLTAEQAYMRAWYDRDADGALAQLAPHTKVLDAVLPVHDRDRLAAALAASGGRTAEAHAHISHGLAHIAKQDTPSGNTLWTKDRLLEMQTVLITA